MTAKPASEFETGLVWFICGNYFFLCCNYSPNFQVVIKKKKKRKEKIKKKKTSDSFGK